MPQCLTGSFCKNMFLAQNEYANSGIVRELLLLYWQQAYNKHFEVAQEYDAFSIFQKSSALLLECPLLDYSQGTLTEKDAQFHQEIF